MSYLVAVCCHNKSYCCNFCLLCHIRA